MGFFSEILPGMDDPGHSSGVCNFVAAEQPELPMAPASEVQPARFPGSCAEQKESNQALTSAE
jgi:hypothetical protein